MRVSLSAPKRVVDVVLAGVGAPLASECSLSVTTRTVPNVEAKPTTTHCSVQDQSAGILPDDLGRLFQPFERLGLDAGGTGLELALCKQFVERRARKVVPAGPAEPLTTSGVDGLLSGPWTPR